jgi:LPXTG-motif cell wall-anchored protein
VAVGAAIVLVSALADPLGLGGEGTGFGTKQVAGVVAGAVVAVAGLGLLYLRRGRTPAPSGD